MSNAEQDKPTLRDVQLVIDRFTADEIALLAGIVDALKRGLHPVTLEPQRKMLERIELKLHALKPAKSDAPPTNEGV